MQVPHRIDAVERLCPCVTAVVLFDRRFSSDVRHAQTLTGSEARVAGEVVVQRLLDLVGLGVPALDAVGVVRIHAAQQRAQLGRHRPAQGHNRSVDGDSTVGALEDTKTPII